MAMTNFAGRAMVDGGNEIEPIPGLVNTVPTPDKAAASSASDLIPPRLIKQGLMLTLLLEAMLNMKQIRQLLQPREIQPLVGRSLLTLLQQHILPLRQEIH